jgi:predicted ArsR family transcriptional regulator
MVADIASRSLSGRIVLLCVTDLERSGSTPAHTGEVIRECKECLDAVEADTFGTLSEAEVNRALNRLEADGLVAMEKRNDASPTGKGRPAYSLAVDAGAVVAALSDDEAVAPLARRVSDAR